MLLCLPFHVHMTPGQTEFEMPPVGVTLAWALGYMVIFAAWDTMPAVNIAYCNYYVGGMYGYA